MAGQKIEAGLSIDNQFHVIPVGNSFFTEKLTLSGSSYEGVTVPSNAVEVMIKSSSDFTVAGADDEEGYSTDELTLGVGNTSSFYIKGSSSQDIYFLWVKV